MSHWLRAVEGFKADDWYDPYTTLNEMPEPVPLEILKDIQSILKQVDAMKF